MKLGSFVLVLSALPVVGAAQNSHPTDYSHPMPQNPLTSAAYDATRKCAELAPGKSLSYCSGSMPGATPAHTAARQAVLAVFRQRRFFMETCVQPYGIENCNSIADAVMDEGAQRALLEK